jgi:hypothetical protein
VITSCFEGLPINETVVDMDRFIHYKKPDNCPATTPKAQKIKHEKRSYFMLYVRPLSRSRSNWF